ncbi:MAG: hypothetical protein AUJ96_18670 [Armatimonadetes bacterium CG2_30_66_41]|nr:hypothetical protein [Armatimonadota bacterium]NCP29113.1 hypothetical protein [Armatimonadota bacterium]OIP00262.1 MAG: hypothetical protein AUJ96_18670 [Armatimonadetes bacterium CG2_30_66_41]PIX43871.1 MAG: hypothetical protein COZ57_18415 [Armatimonadetes bacterium CG_4_8_14_3_um_filter_66_20]
MNVCTECGWRFDDERTKCLICGGEVAPGRSLFLPPPQPLRSHLARLSRRLRPLRDRFRRWVEEADVAETEGPGLLMWWQDLRYHRPGVVAVVAVGTAVVFALIALAPALYQFVLAWLQRGTRGELR